jgi:hypothetical protein
MHLGLNGPLVFESSEKVGGRENHLIDLRYKDRRSYAPHPIGDEELPEALLALNDMTLISGL